MELSKMYLGISENRDEYMMTLHNEGERVGYCKYHVDVTHQTCTIRFININKSQRRKGYATKMVKELQKSFELDWDYAFTDEGKKWYNKLIDRKIIKSVVYE